MRIAVEDLSHLEATLAGLSAFDLVTGLLHTPSRLESIAFSGSVTVDFAGDTVSLSLFDATLTKYRGRGLEFRSCSGCRAIRGM